MKKTNSLLLMALFAVTTLFSACKKEEGPAGPAGPTGPQGNANVKSLIITTVPADWTGDGNGFSATKDCAIITQDIADDGAVLCYISEEGSYLPLPFSVWQGSWTSHYLFTHDTGTISFIVQDNDGMTPAPGTVTFKVVAIASKALQSHPNLDLNNYSAVKEAFNLVD